MSKLLDKKASPPVLSYCAKQWLPRNIIGLLRGGEEAQMVRGVPHSQQVPGELGGHWPGKVKVGQQTGTETVS